MGWSGDGGGVGDAGGDDIGGGRSGGVGGRRVDGGCDRDFIDKLIETFSVFSSDIDEEVRIEKNEEEDVQDEEEVLGGGCGCG